MTATTEQISLELARWVMAAVNRGAAHRSRDPSEIARAARGEPIWCSRSEGPVL